MATLTRGDRLCGRYTLIAKLGDRLGLLGKLCLKRCHGRGDDFGNIVEINAPAIEIGKISQGQTDGILNYSIPLSFCPVTGRDELSIVVR